MLLKCFFFPLTCSVQLLLSVQTSLLASEIYMREYSPGGIQTELPFKHTYCNATFSFSEEVSRILHEKGCVRISLKLDFGLFSAVLEEIVGV